MCSCFAVIKMAVFVEIFLAINISWGLGQLLLSAPAGTLFNDILGVPDLSWLVWFWKFVGLFPIKLIQHLCIISDPLNQIRRYTALS